MRLFQAIRGKRVPSRCWIYKSRRKEEMYLYLPVRGDFSGVPEALLAHFGTPEFVMSLDLDASRRLARADIAEVQAQLRDHGYYLQMPPPPGEAPSLAS